jgi:repressor LexA
LSFIRTCINTRYPPTVREIADHFGISIKGAYDHLVVLKKKNRIRMGRSPRTIEIITTVNEEDPAGFVEIPILGCAAAGSPLNGESNREGTILVPRSMIKEEGVYFALRVQGDSMNGAGILDGDLAVIRQTELARDGEIAAVRVNGAAALKRFFQESSRVRLQPENPACRPIYSSLENIRILGRLVHLSRSY